MFRMVLAILMPTNNDSGYMFRIVLGILYPIQNSMFRLLLAFP